MSLSAVADRDKRKNSKGVPLLDTEEQELPNLSSEQIPTPGDSEDVERACFLCLEGDLEDDRFHENLWAGYVELFDDFSQCVVVLRGRGDDQGIGCGIGGHADIAFEVESRTAAGTCALPAASRGGRTPAAQASQTARRGCLLYTSDAADE